MHTVIDIGDKVGEQHEHSKQEQSHIPTQPPLRLSQEQQQQAELNHLEQRAKEEVFLWSTQEIPNEFVSHTM
jgi:hypothetical protein